MHRAWCMPRRIRNAGWWPQRALLEEDRSGSRLRGSSQRCERPSVWWAACARRRVQKLHCSACAALLAGELICAAEAAPLPSSQPGFGMGRAWLGCAGRADRRNEDDQHQILCPLSDGDNDSFRERSDTSALASGCTEDSIDIAAIARVADWISELPAATLAS